MIMRLKERRGRETLSSLSSSSVFPEEGRERERECNTCAGKLRQTVTEHVLRKMTKEEAAKAKEIEEKNKNDTTENKEEQPEATEEEEEEETCGFCAYMKGGSCKQEFMCWEKCVDDAKANEEDFVAKCVEETTALRECMMKDPGYYGEMDDEGGGNDDDDDDDDDEKSKRSENNKSRSESSRKDRSSEKEQKR